MVLDSEIYAISPAFEENPKAVHIHSKINTKHKILTSGMYIQGKIIVEAILTNVLPEQAVVREKEKCFIFVKLEHKQYNEEEHDLEFEQKEVITGIISDGYIEIKLLNALSDNAQIVEKGAYYLLAEKGKESTEHSH